MKTTNLDNVSTALEKIVKDLRGGRTTTKKRMPLHKFVDYAVAEIEKAGKEEPEVAQRRLGALKRTVDALLARVAKMAAEDLDSEAIQVDVVTAFAPTRAQGDTPMDDLTTAGDQSSTEIDLESISVATGDSALAENLGAAVKALKKMKAGLEAPDGKPRKPTKKADRQRTGHTDGDRDADRDDGDGADEGVAAGDGWPLDLNSAAFLKGDKDAAGELDWGVDPDQVAAGKTR